MRGQHLQINDPLIMGLDVILNNWHSWLVDQYEVYASVHVVKRH